MSDSLQTSIDCGDLAKAWDLARSRFAASFDNGHLDDALEYAELCVDLAQRELTAPHVNIAVSLADCGLAHWTLNHPRPAAQFLRRGLKMQQEVLPPFDPAVGNTIMNLAVVLCDARQYEEAERLLGQALRIFNRCKRASRVADVHYSLASLYVSKKRKAKARTHFERAIAMYRRTRDVAAGRKASIRVDLANLLLELHRPKEAEQRLREAYRIQSTAADYENETWIAQMLDIIKKRVALEGKRGRNTSRLEQRKDELEQAIKYQAASVWMD